MANVQKEKGYTQIANELLDVLIMVPLSDYEHRVFLYILRKTYGFSKKQDWISQKQIAKDLGIHKCNISRTIRKLKEKNMIINTVEKKKKILGIQKDYERWKLSKEITNKVIQTGNKYKNLKKKLSKEITEVIHTDNQKLSIQTHTKETIQKKLLQKNIYSHIPYKKIEKLFTSICVSLPKIKELTSKRKKAIKSRWLKYKNIKPFEELFKKAEASDFLSGRNGKWTSCNFDWLINENNMIKVLEGNYDNRKGNNGKPKRFGYERSYTDEQWREIEQKFENK